MLALIPLLLAIVAEGAWIAVVAGLVQEWALRPPRLGLGAFVALVGTGVVAARLLGPRFGARWPIVACVVMAIAGAIGWLASPDARAALAEVGLGHALAVHPGGWLAALAVLRGFAHATPHAGEATLGRLVTVGVPGLVIAAIAGGMVSEPWRSQFLGDAFVASIVFATSATLSLALVRLTAVGAGSGFDWRRNPAWVGLLIVLLGMTALLAIPASIVAGPLISIVIGIAVAPILLVGLVAGFVIGFDRRTVRVVGLLVAVAIGLSWVLTLIGRRTQPLQPSAAAPGTTATATEPGQVVAVGAAIIGVAALLAAVALARLWMRRVVTVVDGVVETRTIDRGDGRRVPRPRTGRQSRRLTPVDAVTAYVALDEELARRGDLGREPAETPAEHARRLRAEGRRELGLDLLAADYALVRFAGVELSPIEHRRAIGRWRALRLRLREPGD